MTGSEAGSSATEIARRHREKIARLERSAVAWEAGARGEAATGEVLSGLAESGWSVMHDLPWPGREKANLDHVVVGPGGVFVIDTKNWSGRIEVRDGVLRQNGRSRESSVAGASDAATAVRQLIPGVPVQPVLCLHGEEPRRDQVRDVVLCSTSTLRELLESRPELLSADQVGEVTARLSAGLVRSATPRSATGSRRSTRSGRPARERSAGVRLVAFLLVAAMMFAGLQSGLFSAAADKIGDLVVGLVVDDTTKNEPPAKPQGERRHGREAPVKARTSDGRSGR